MDNLGRKINEVPWASSRYSVSIAGTDTTLEQKNPNPRAKVFTEVMVDGFRI